MKFLILIIFSSILFGQEQNMVNLANEAFNNKKYQKAFEMYESFIDDDFEKAEYYYFAGMSLFHLKEYEDAVDYLEEACEKKPKNVDWLKHYTNALGEYGEEASILSQMSIVHTMKDTWIKIIELDPDNVKERRHLARYYLFAPSFIGKDIEAGMKLVDEIRKRDESCLGKN